MSTSSKQPAETFFARERGYLRGIAYRMLGTLSDAEDVLQDAYMRVAKVDFADVEHPRAYLAQIVARLCVDHLRSARVRREKYVGPWLPEPVVQTDASERGTPEVESLLRDDISMALMLALERLSPLERAAFILHDVFELDYEQVASSLGREQAACRQLAARARKRIQEQRPRFVPTPEKANQLLSAFSAAARSGDIAALEKFLTHDVTFTSDGGGRVAAATKIVRGSANVARFVAGISKKYQGQDAIEFSLALINGQPGVIMREQGRVAQAVLFDVERDQITAIYAIRNPEKLRHLQPASPGME